MIRVSLKSMAGRKVRTALTAFAIVLGVAMVAGAFTITDTMRGASDSLSKAAYDQTDAAVVGHTAFDLSTDSAGGKPSIPESTLADVRANPQVGTAVGEIMDEARLVKDGDTVGDGPYFGAGIDPRAAGNQDLNPFRLVDGDWATGPGQVVIDKGTADKQGWKVGDDVLIATRGPAKPYEVTGVVRFGSVKSLGTATVTIFDLETAQSVFAKQGKLDSVLVAAKDGVAPAALRRSLDAALPATVDVKTAKADDRFDLGGLDQFIKFIRVFLLVFGGVAVTVGALTILNTLSITVAQRQRELALSRMMGASRRQVLGSVMLEALTIGVVGSVVGLAVGFGLAQGLLALFASIGLDLPDAGTVFAARTIVISMAVGVVVTLVAGLIPAVRATRVAPIQALRPESADKRGRMGRIMAPIVSLVGAPAQRLTGSAGLLARRNATRNPGRTAATASALMVGVALVAAVAVLGNGLKESAQGSLRDQLRSDFVVVNQDGWSTISPEGVAAAAKVPGVTATTGVLQDQARIGKDEIQVAGVEPASYAATVKTKIASGPASAPAELATGQALVTDSVAKDRHLKVGSSVTVTAPSGKTVTAKVAAITEPAKLDTLALGDVTLPLASYSAAFSNERPGYALVNGGDLATLKQTLRQYPESKVQSREDFITGQTEWVDMILAIFYVMLALAVIVSLFGIVNTLVLSTFERTRELGMLRAVGMSRRQVRRMVRQESIITAVLGAAMGIVVGLGLAGIVTALLADEGIVYAIPVGALITFVVVAIFAGMAAAILPARRASRLDVLQALAYE
jgi:putative ABC transport system permease protein